MTGEQIPRNSKGHMTWEPGQCFPHRFDMIKAYFVYTYLHSVSSVFVVKDKCFLNELMVSLQLVDVGFIFDDALLVLAEVGQLILQSSIHLNGYPTNLLQTSRHGHRLNISSPQQLKSNIHTISRDVE